MRLYLDEIYDQFDKQFAVEDSGLVYRKNQNGMAIPVTGDQYSRFLAAFRRRVRMLFVAFFIGSIVLVDFNVRFINYFAAETEGFLIFTQLVVFWSLLIFFFHRAWNAPLRSLSGVSPVERPLSREETQRLVFERISYAQLGGVVVAGLLVMAKGYGYGGRFGSESSTQLWIWLGAALIVVAIVQAIRKRRFERKSRL